MRLTIALVALVVAMPPGARAATQLVVSTPTRTLRLAPPDATFVIEPTERNGTTGTRVYMGNYPDAEYELYFVPPPGQEYAPGTYEGVASFDGLAPRSGMYVTTRDSSSCFPEAVRFTILDVAYIAGEMVRLSVDFEQDCAGGTGAKVAGSLRVAAGDAACGGLSDG